MPAHRRTPKSSSPSSTTSQREIRLRTDSTATAASKRGPNTLFATSAGSAHADSDARSPGQRSPAALRPDDAPAHPRRAAHPQRRHGHTRNAQANTQSPRPPRRAPTAPGRDPRAPAAHPANAPSDPCLAQAAAACPEDQSSAAARNYANSWPTRAPASPPAPPTAGSGDPSPTTPRLQPHAPRHRSPPPQHAPHPKIQQSTVMTPNQLNAYGFWDRQAPNFNRGARIRTGDLGHPKAARYQAAPRPEALQSRRTGRAADIAPRPTAASTLADTPRC